MDASSTDLGLQFIIFKELWSPGRFRCVTITPDEVTVVGRGQTGTRPGPGQDGFNALIEQLRDLGVFEWKRSYVDPNVIDGYLWQVEVRGERLAWRSFGQRSGVAATSTELLEAVRRTIIAE